MTFYLFFLVIVSYSIFLQQSKKRKKKKQEKQNRIRTELVKKRDYPGLVQHYTERASRAERPYLRYHFLGHAALWRQDAAQAIHYFERAEEGAVGEDLQSIGNYLVDALLQVKNYEAALKKSESLREKGPIYIVPHTIALIANGYTERANRFLENYRNEIEEEERNYLDIFIEASSLNTGAIQLARNCLRDNPFTYKYNPVLQLMVDRWELWAFFTQEDWRKRLIEGGLQALATLDQEETVFRDGRVRILRTMLNAIVQKLHGKEENLYGLIDHLDQFAEELPLSDGCRSLCVDFFRKVDYVFWNENKIQTYRPTQEEKFLEEQMRSHFKRIGSNMSLRCELYVNEAEHVVITVIRIHHQDTPVHYAEVVSGNHARFILDKVQPLIEKAATTPEARLPLEPLFELYVRRGKFVAEENVREILKDIPEIYHP